MNMLVYIKNRYVYEIGDVGEFSLDSRVRGLKGKGVKRSVKRGGLKGKEG